MVIIGAEQRRKAMETLLLATGVPRRRTLFVKTSTTQPLRDVTSSIQGAKINKPEGLAEWKTHLEETRFTIEQHLEKRVSLLFLQAVLCYRTSYTFEEGKTLHQGFSASNPCQAAHSATLPNLYALSSKTNQKFVYLYRSGAYDENNATIDLIKAVNDADRAIDEKYQCSLLRKKTIALLNQGARGELTPEEISKRFIRILLGQLDESIEKEKNKEVKDVLLLYRDKAELLWSYVDNPECTDRWLNVDMDDPLLSEVSQTIEQIKQEEVVPRDPILALIKKKIDVLPVVIRQKRHQKHNESRTPNYFYELYHLAVLQHFKGRRLAVIEEAMDLKKDKLSKRAKNFQRTGTTNALLQKKSKKIQALVKEIIPLTTYLLGGKIDPDQVEGLSSKKKVCLRPDVYRLRYKMIRADQKAQSHIKTKIEKVLTDVKKERAMRLELFFYQALFDRAIDDSMRTMLAKLLNISPFRLKQAITELKVNQRAYTTLETHASQISKISERVTKIAAKPTGEKKEALKKKIKHISDQLISERNSASIQLLLYNRLFEGAATKKEKTLLEELLSKTEKQIKNEVLRKTKVMGAETAVKKYTAKIQEVIDLVITETNCLERKTIRFRHRLMHELRMSHGMSQKLFKATYKKDYPAYPMSDGTMHNLENGIKKITPSIIAQLSEIFSVRTQLFYPSHFATV